jgi:hypothetical protein
MLPDRASTSVPLVRILSPRCGDRSMSQGDQDRLKGNIKNDAGRADRLAAELRRNLNRRKQRSRAVAASRKGNDGQAPSLVHLDDPSK